MTDEITRALQNGGPLNVGNPGDLQRAFAEMAGVVKQLVKSNNQMTKRVNELEIDVRQANQITQMTQGFMSQVLLPHIGGEPVMLWRLAIDEWNNNAFIQSLEPVALVYLPGKESVDVVEAFARIQEIDEAEWVLYIFAPPSSPLHDTWDGVVVSGASRNGLLRNIENKIKADQWRAEQDGKYGPTKNGKAQSHVEIPGDQKIETSAPNHAEPQETNDSGDRPSNIIAGK